MRVGWSLAGSTWDPALASASNPRETEMGEPQDIEETGATTLSDEEIETVRVGATAAPAASTADDGDDSGDTGDDSGDVSDTSDTGDDSGDSTDTGDDSAPGA
jgi:hypothetical protein